MCSVLSHFGCLCSTLRLHGLWPPGSSVHGILQARVLEWAAMPSSGDLHDPGNEPMFLMSAVLAGRFFIIGTTWEAHTGLRPTLIQHAYILITSATHGFQVRAQSQYWGRRLLGLQRNLLGNTTQPIISLCKSIWSELNLHRIDYCSPRTRSVSVL